MKVYISKYCCSAVPEYTEVSLQKAVLKAPSRAVRLGADRLTKLPCLFPRNGAEASSELCHAVRTGLKTRFL